jgi:probable HAF family extracellular repeat protein
MNTFRQLRNFWIPWVTTIVLACFSHAVAQTSYTVTDLGTLHNGNIRCAMALNNQGWTLFMDGNAIPGQQDNLFGTLLSGHAVVNIDGILIDLGTLGGANSWMNWGGINDRGQAVGMAETSVPDPDDENICQFATGRECRPFLWQGFHISALPTLGGHNGQASDINNRGQIAGTAETADPDSGCPASRPHHISLPVLWEGGQVQTLPTVGNDPDGMAIAINDDGQAVGQSANCTGSIIRAVRWENNTVFTLPDLGTGAIAQGINHQGTIVGIVGSSDNTTEFAAIWQNGVLTNLGTLPGDFASIGTGINNRGQVVGSAFDSGFNWSHGFIWQDGVMTDLNTLFPASSNLFATMANKINERGQISGMAIVLSGPEAGDIHAFLATPVNASIGMSVADVAPAHPKSNFPANVGKQLLQRFGLGPFAR